MWVLVMALVRYGSNDNIMNSMREDELNGLPFWL